MNLDKTITIKFANKIHEKVELKTTYRNLIAKNEDELIEELEPPCTDSSCIANGFCECNAFYEDYFIVDVAEESPSDEEIIKNLLTKNKLTGSPKNRSYGSDHYDICLAIGKDEAADLTISKEGLEYLGIDTKRLK